MDLLPGDIVVVAGRGWLADSIRWFTRGRGERERSRVSHVGLITRPGVITEALSTVVRRGFREAYTDTTFTVYRPLTQSADDITAICAEMESHVGERYPYGRIMLQALDGALSKVFGGTIVLFRRLSVTHRYECSARVALAEARRGVYFGRAEPACATPDDIDDYCYMHPKEWAVLWPLKKWEGQ